MPVPYVAAMTTVIGAIGAIYMIVQLTKKLTSQYRESSRAPIRSSNDDESGVTLCQTCEIPLNGDESTWKVFDCGHSYHGRCFSLFATINCVECELRAAQRSTVSERVGDS